MKVFKKPLWIALTAVFVVLFVAMMVAGSIANSYRRTINNYFQLPNYRTETILTEETANIDREYFKSEFVQYGDDGEPLYVQDEGSGYIHQFYDDRALHDYNTQVALQVQREGTTILWNENGGMPLAKGNKVSLFSASSVDYVSSGWGSGAADTSGAPNMYTALSEAGLDVNVRLWQFYNSGAGSKYRRTESSKVNEVPWSEYTDTEKNTFSQYGDAAIVVLARRTGEEPYTDAFMSGADTLNGDYFQLSQQEKDLLDNLVQYKKSGTFKKIIVLLNTAVGLNFDVLGDYRGDVDACLWVGQCGTFGLTEVGNILAGRSVPSGHLVDTFLYDNRSAPASVNVEYQEYTNAGSMDLDRLDFQGRYTTYSENIYVGYKYFETRYEDAVLNQGNAASGAGVRNSSGNWVYGEEVAFPLGHGEAYTTFSYTDYDVRETSDGNYEVSLTVTNTGDKNGADAVQIYVQKPYTQFDKDNGIEQAAVNLAGYAKTAELTPGETEKVTVTVRDDAFKTYDDAVNGTYIREAGTYYIAAGEDAHDAVNNILAAKGKTPANTNNVMDAEGDSSLVRTFEFDDTDTETFSVTDKTEAEIVNRFEFADWNKYENKTETDLTYLSRKDWNGTYPTRVRLSMNEAMVEELRWNKPVAEDPDAVMPTYGADKVFDLIDLRGIEYDHDSWDQLLDQLTWDDMVSLQRAMMGTPGLSGENSINKPSEVINDGPLGVRRNYTTNYTSGRSVSFPLSCLLAASYNDDLSYEVGRGMGEDMLHTGCNGIYAPTANLHRSAYGGRTYEYYSEDGFLTGMMAKYQIRGMQELGCIVVMKHFALNDQESQRKGVNTWANEQTIREIYLPAFQYAVEEENLKVMMDSFNRLGTKWCGASEELLVDVLRNEWGFDGYVISDCPWEVYMGVVDALLAGQDCILYETPDLSALEAEKDSPTVAQALRESTHRILYVTVNSNAMNGFVPGTRIIDLRHWWQNAILAIQIVLGVFAAASAAMLVLSFVLKKKKPAAAEETAEGGKNE